MKPSYQQLEAKSNANSFLCYKVVSEKFGFHWHYHPEVEISLVINGFGNRLIGDNVEDFESGDLLILGSDLPHTLISNELFNQSDQRMEVIVIQFRKELFEVGRMDVVELDGIRKLIDNSSRGLNITIDLTSPLATRIAELPALNGFPQYHSFLEILNEIGRLPFKKLASEYYTPNKRHNTEERIGKVCSFIHENFTEDISISELSGLINMSNASFCRFFKAMTGTTAVNYVNDLRIGQACQLLQESDYSVGEIAYEVGFNSISYFNRCFTKKMGEKPTAYKKKFIVRVK